MDVSSIAAGMVRAVHEQLLDVGASFGAVAAMLGVVALLWKWPLGPMFRWFRELGRRLDMFWGDWFGQEDRPGVPGRPGVMTQLADQRQQLADQSAALGEMHDSWSSLRDRLRKVETDLLSVREQLRWLMSPAGKGANNTPEGTGGC